MGWYCMVYQFMGEYSEKLYNVSLTAVGEYVRISFIAGHTFI